ncbi:MAG: hypothetical protein HZB71_05705 [Betaproteobacteria bacterium]|nr:hypothetical protein [Betaproteobacteria bacterium]
MGMWIRGGEPPDEIKVTFVVNSKKDPELAAWLWGLPYRGTSASVRDILSAAARLLRQQASAVTPDAQQTTPVQSAAIPATASHPRREPVAPVDGPKGMTEAVANLMREMDDEF